MFEVILPAAFKIIAFIINRVNLSHEAKENWLKLVAIIEEEKNISVRLHDDDRKQAEELRKKWKKSKINRGIP